MIFIANWKDKQSLANTKKFIRELKEKPPPKGADIIICPSNDFLNLPKWESLPISLGAQDLTDINLKDLGVEYCLVGHSDLRKRGESEKDIANKVGRLSETGITPLLCFSKESQIQAYRTRKDVIFCFEPPENISGGKQFKKVNPEEIGEKLARMRKLLDYQAKILYGGSVNKENVQDLARIPQVEGFLIGQASLDYNHFSRIIYAVS